MRIYATKLIHSVNTQSGNSEKAKQHYFCSGDFARRYNYMLAILCLSVLLLIVLFPQSRPEMPLDDVTALYTSLVNLALKCYSDRIDYVDKALECTLNVITKREAAP